MVYYCRFLLLEFFFCFVLFHILKSTVFFRCHFILSHKWHCFLLLSDHHIKCIWCFVLMIMIMMMTKAIRVAWKQLMLVQYYHMQCTLIENYVESVRNSFYHFSMSWNHNFLPSMHIILFMSFCWVPSGVSFMYFVTSTHKQNAFDLKSLH